MRKLLAIPILLLISSQAWGATFDNTGYLYRKAITLSGTGSDETNYIIRMNLHRGSAVGDNTDSDVYLDGFPKTDFSDIRFTDADGEELIYYRHSYGNYEIVPDNTTLNGKTVIYIGPDGTLYASGYTGGIYKSINNGTNWTNMYDNTVYGMVYVNSNGDLFASTGITAGRFNNAYQLIRSASTDTDHTTWDNVLDMSSVSGLGLSTSMVEDPEGNLYFGRYQGAASVAIYKSADNGATWSAVYTNTSGSYTHVHAMYVDNNVDPVAIYAGIDGTSKGALKSTNAGVDWEFLTNSGNVLGNFTMMYAGDGFRLFGTEASINSGWSLYRTTDDSAYSPAIQTGQHITGIRPLGSAIYSFGASNGLNKYAQILRSIDNGVSWNTIWMDHYGVFSSVYAGFQHATPAGIPTTSDEQQLILGVIDNATPINHFRNSRVYDGGNHYQGLFYVKIPSLPSAGGDIYVWYGNDSATTESDNTIFAPVTQSGLLGWWKFNEGVDNTITDSSGNGKHGVLIPGAGSWGTSEGRKAGASSPSITQEGHYYHFDNSAVTNVSITGSSTDPDFAFVKNFTFIVWLRIALADRSSQLQWVIGRGGYGYDPMGIAWRSDGSQLSFAYNNAAGVQQGSTPAGDGFIRSCLGDGGWHMLSVTLDNTSPPNITWTIDAQESTTVALSDTPRKNTQYTFYIADALIPSVPDFKGDVDDVQVYNVALTTTQIRQIYESRMFGATEPGITDLGAYEYQVSSRRLLHPGVKLGGKVNIRQ